ncbi:hypothetical protein HYN48_06660 [Flavobacterium magnum]|uniref:N-acetyltransferase domain-containing protein n=1 Tax=Flavobacterium magnum TaxID=2162713 RepID=A0A2S0RDG3_9FLAO|nr:hypothetical protein HYN48_06660 [Flavobacterium magnum]
MIAFFRSVYPANHPLQQRMFWNWQYGDKAYGRSFISLDENGDITGHVGASFAGGVAWIINVYLLESCRGKGVLRELYGLARQYHPLAATAANAAGLGLYRNMGWIRYHDLIRLVKINPNMQNASAELICSPAAVAVDDLVATDTHYFRQPGIKGVLFDDGTRAVSQDAVGGLRICDFDDASTMESLAWEKGYHWVDYITSWNDMKLKYLEAQHWMPDRLSVIPWRLNPVEFNYFCDITFLSEEPLDKKFVVHRSYSDHGRVGSLK